MYIDPSNKIKEFSPLYRGRFDTISPPAQTICQLPHAKGREKREKKKKKKKKGGKKKKKKIKGGGGGGERAKAGILTFLLKSMIFKTTINSHIYMRFYDLLNNLNLLSGLHPRLESCYLKCLGSFEYLNVEDFANGWKLKLKGNSILGGRRGGGGVQDDGVSER